MDSSNADGASPHTSTEKIADIEAAKLLFDEWKFRHAHCWSVLTRYYVAAVVVSGAPYVVMDGALRTQLRYFLLLFPVAGAILGLAAIWVYGAEYVRMQVPLEQYREIMERNELYKRKNLNAPELKTLDRWLLRQPIGYATLHFLSMATILLACGNFMVVLGITV